jgi:hypothetical protein
VPRPRHREPLAGDGKAAGFDFVALRTVEDFVAESEALENCLDQYADQLHTGLTAVFSIRKGARRVACVEIGLHDEEVSMPNIVQLRAARNRRAPPEIWQATYSWIGGQRLMPLSPLRHAPNRCSASRRAASFGTRTWKSWRARATPDPSGVWCSSRCARLDWSPAGRDCRCRGRPPRDR